MKELRNSFKRGPREFRLLHRGNNLFIYEVTMYNNGEKDVFYEVFDKKVTGMHPLSENYDPEEKVEAYPSDECFGKWAWCCSNGKAIIKVLMEHYDYTTQEIQNLCLLNPKLAFLNECLDSYPTEVVNAVSIESGEEEKKV